jgi:pheromone shutdown protein TraB
MMPASCRRVRRPTARWVCDLGRRSSSSLPPPPLPLVVEVSETVSRLRRSSASGAGGSVHGDVWLIGTAHGSRASAQSVRELIEEVKPDVVMVELCAGRAEQMRDGEGGEGDESATSPERKGLVALCSQAFESAGLGGASNVGIGAYGALLQSLGMDSGQDMLAAMETAESMNVPVIYGDRPVQQTLDGLRAAMGWGELLHMMQAASGASGVV